MKCRDCWRLENDFACLGMDGDDDYANRCIGFLDLHEENLIEIFRYWNLKGMYSREKIMALCERFENSSWYKADEKEEETDETSD